MRVSFFRSFGILLALSTMYFAPVVMAADASSLPQTVVLHIDEGFLGHTVNLDLFNGDVHITWDAGDVVAPGDLTVTEVSSTQIDVEWSTSYVLGSRGILVGFSSPTSTSPFDAARIEVKRPFGDWQTGNRIVAEGSVRLVLSPNGMRQGTATWYRYKKCLCAASPDFPKGTSLLVRLMDQPDKNVIVKVNDFGPDRNLFPNRVIDLDSTAFIKLSPLAAGMLRVTVEPL